MKKGFKFTSIMHFNNDNKVTSPSPKLGEGAVVRALRNAGEEWRKHVGWAFLPNRITSPVTPSLKQINPSPAPRRVNSAFTLAEVLITLGIIGVVAAITMPTLISKYKDMVFENQRKAAISKISQAISMMHAKDLLSESTDANFLIEALTKELKVLNICQKGDISLCFPDKVTQITEEVFADGNKQVETKNINRESFKLKLLVAGAQRYSNSDMAGFILADGTYMVFIYDPNCTYPEIDKSSGIRTLSPYYSDIRACFGAIVDVNGNKAPNILDKDVFLYQTSISLEPDSQIRD